MTRLFERTLDLPVSPTEAFAWHGRRGVFERLAPPWQTLEAVQRNAGLTDGSKRIFRIRQGPASITWRARHEPLPDGSLGFVDVQEAGPFASWRHEHRFEAVRQGEEQGEEEATASPGGRMVDRIEYRLPLGPLGDLVAQGRIADDLDALFAWRHHVTWHDLRLHARTAATESGRWTIAIAGASGLIGTRLRALLSTGGHRVIRIVRRPTLADDAVAWTGTGFDDPSRLEGLDAFVDLAGENVAGGRWTPSRRRRIDASRGERVEQVVRALGRLATPPKTFVCASGVGIHGDTGSRVVGEGEGADAPGARPASGFLAEVARRWEVAALGAEVVGCRTVLARFGVVLSPEGGALGKMLPPFRLGLGAVPGSGEQQLSWITVDDAAAAVVHALGNEDVRGPVHVVAPETTTQAGLCRALGKVLSRPVLARVPASALRLGLGDMADETLLASTGVRPDVLAETGFDHRDPELSPALALMLGRAQTESSRPESTRPESSRKNLAATAQEAPT